MFKNLKILNFDNLYKLALGKLMYRVCNNDIPLCLQNLFHMNNEYHNYYTSRNTGPHILRNNCEVFKQSYLYQAPKLWLDLNDNIKNSISRNQFKNKIQEELDYKLYMTILKKR